MTDDHGDIVTDSTKGSGKDIDGVAEERELLTKTPAHALCEIQRRTSLSWEQIGALFGLSRHGIRDWSNGVQLSAENERDVWRALEAIRHVDETWNIAPGSATLDRIMDASHGPSIFDLLVQRRYDEVLALPAGAGDPSPPYRTRGHLFPALSDRTRVRCAQCPRKRRFAGFCPN